MRRITTALSATALATATAFAGASVASAQDLPEDGTGVDPLASGQASLDVANSLPEPLRTLVLNGVIAPAVIPSVALVLASSDPSGGA